MIPGEKQSHVVAIDDDVFDLGCRQLALLCLEISGLESVPQRHDHVARRIALGDRARMAGLLQHIETTRKIPLGQIEYAEVLFRIIADDLKANGASHWRH